MAYNSDLMDLYNRLNAGGISNAESANIIEQIRSNPEMAQEFDDFQKIEQGIAQDYEAFEPPPEMKDSVFKGLGLTVPTNTIVNIATRTPFAVYFRRAIIPIAGALLIGLMSYNYFNNNETSNQVSQAETKLKSNHVSANATDLSIANKSSANAMISSKKEIPVSSNSNSKIIRHKNKNIFDDNSSNLQKQDKNDDNLAASNKIIESELSPQANNAPIQPVSLSMSNVIPERMSPPNIGRTDEAQTVSLFNDSFSTNSSFVTVRGIAGTTFSKGFDFEGSLLNSISLGFYTNMLSMENLGVGFEGGYEPFEKKYFDKWEPSKLVSIDNPSMFWGALALRYSSNTYIIPSINAAPFATFMLGANEIGPLSKALIGIDYDISSAMNLYTAMDATMVFYQNRVEWLTSKKLSFTVGASYHF